MSTITGLDQLNIGILEAIYFSDGERVDTTEIKQYTGFGGDNRKLTYRRDHHLGELVESEVVTKNGTQITEWWLTDQGRDRLERHLDQEQNVPIVQQVEQLGEQVDKLSEHVEQLSQDVGSFDYRVGVFEEEVQEMDTKVEKRLLEDEEAVEAAAESVLSEKLDARMRRVKDELEQAQSVLDKIERADAMNHDVRTVLNRAGILKPCRGRDGRDAYEMGPVAKELIR